MGWSAALTQVGYERLTKEASMELQTIGIDLGKTVFHLVGLNRCGEVVVRKKFGASSCCALRRTCRSN